MNSNLTSQLLLLSYIGVFCCLIIPFWIENGSDALIKKFKTTTFMPKMIFFSFFKQLTYTLYCQVPSVFEHCYNIHYSRTFGSNRARLEYLVRSFLLDSSALTLDGPMQMTYITVPYHKNDMDYHKNVILKGKKHLIVCSLFIQGFLHNWNPY